MNKGAEKLNPPETRGQSQQWSGCRSTAREAMVGGHWLYFRLALLYHSLSWKSPSFVRHPSRPRRLCPCPKAPPVCCSSTVWMTSSYPKPVRSSSNYRCLEEASSASKPLLVEEYACYGAAPRLRMAGLSAGRMGSQPRNRDIKDGRWAARSASLVFRSKRYVTYLGAHP